MFGVGPPFERAKYGVWPQEMVVACLSKSISNSVIDDKSHTITAVKIYNSLITRRRIQTAKQIKCYPHLCD